MVYGDRIQETTTTTGTGTITLGGAVTGFQSFSNAFANGTVVTYTIAGGAEWEVGEGTYSAGTLTRTTIFSSSNSNSLVTFSAGTKAVFCDAPANIFNNLVNLYNSINGLRLTLTTGVPVPTADVATATTIYLTPYTSGSIGLYYNGSWRIVNTAEISLAVGTKIASTNYDIFAYYTGSIVALEFSTAWTNATTRATGLARQDGVLVKSGDNTRRYLGTVRTVSTTQVADTITLRHLYNEYNQVDRTMFYLPASSWTCQSSTVRQANGTIGFKLDLVVGNPTQVNVNIYAPWTNSGTFGSGQVYYTGIGLGNTTMVSQGQPPQIPANGFVSTAQSEYQAIQPAGFQSYWWLETATISPSNASIYSGTAGLASSIMKLFVRM